MNKSEQLVALLLETRGESAKQFILRQPKTSMPNEFLYAYMEAALWSSTDAEGNSFEGGTLSPEAEKQMERDCKNFWKENYNLIKDRPSHAGHDFWLSRNGHGTGFFDDDAIFPAADQLQKSSREYGEQNLYVDHAGLVQID